MVCFVCLCLEIENKFYWPSVLLDDDIISIQSMCVPAWFYMLPVHVSLLDIMDVFV